MANGFDRRLGPQSRRDRAKISISEPDDRQQGQWPRDKLEDMNARFVAKMNWAFQWGHESRASASAQVEVPTTSAPRFSAPLSPDVWAALLRTSI